MRFKQLVCLALTAVVACGCTTRMVMSGVNYVEPAPQPHLALFQTPHGILVKYEALVERNGSLATRQYYLADNQERVRGNKRPNFSNAKTVATTSIPILSKTPNPVPEGIFALSETNAFSLYKKGQFIGRYNLPLFRDPVDKAERAMLVPLAVIADVTIIGGLIAYCTEIPPNTVLYSR